MCCLPLLIALFAVAAPVVAQIDSVVARSETKLIATPIVDGLYGTAVAIDADTLVVGAMLDDGSAARSGAAYVFVRSGGTWTLQAKLTAADGDVFDLFGISVAIDGDTIAVGAQGDDDSGATSGSAYVFVRVGSVWTEQAKLTAADGAEGDFFGQGVGVSGDTVIVSAYYDQDAGFASGSAYVFDRSGTVWTETTKLTPSDHDADDYFGFAVALEGDTAVIGSPENDDAGSQSGSAYVFVRSAGVWSEQAKLTASNASAESFFGYALALDGNNVIIGGRKLFGVPGSAYVFVRSGSTWTEQAELTVSPPPDPSSLGAAVAISGDTAIVGGPTSNDGGTDAGAIHVFGRAGTAWGAQAKIVPTDTGPGHVYGTSVGLAAATVVVGAPRYAGSSDTGSAYVYELTPGLNAGGRLSIKNALPDNPDKNRLRYGALAGGIAPAASGSSGDPRCGAGAGGAIEASSSASGQTFAQTLPCGLWTSIGDPANPKGYRYKDPLRSAGPCTRVLLKAGKLRAVCSGRVASALGYDLQPGQSEAPASIIVAIGARTYCGRFGGDVVKDGSNGKAFVARDPTTSTACE